MFWTHPIPSPTAPLQASEIDLLTRSARVGPILVAIVLFALGFMISMASVDTSTSLILHSPVMAQVLLLLPSALVACFATAWVINNEFDVYFEAGLVQLVGVAVVLLAVYFGFGQLAHSKVGATLAPGWAHAARLFALSGAPDEIKAGGGSMETAPNRLIAQALQSGNYEDVAKAYHQYESRIIQGEAFSRWIMAHRLYPIYDKKQVEAFQAIGWADEKTIERVAALAMEMPPPAGSTLIQQQAWAVLAWEADPMTKIGDVLVPES